jgi:hypothetical protein
LTEGQHNTARIECPSNNSRKESRRSMTDGIFQQRIDARHWKIRCMGLLKYYQLEAINATASHSYWSHAESIGPVTFPNYNNI